MAAPATIEFRRSKAAPRFRWAVVVAALGICTLGAVRSGIFLQSIWDPAGEQRFLLYTGIFAAAAALIFAVHRAALLPCVAGAWVVYAAALSGVPTVLAPAYFALACYGIGLAVLRALRLLGREHIRPLSLDVLALVAGAGVWGFLVSFLAFTKWNWASAHGLLLAVPALAAGRSIWTRRRAAPGERRVVRQTAAGYWALALLLYVLGAHFLMGLKPEVSADGIAIHLAVPMHVAVHHNWHFDVSQVSWAVMPMTAEWCFTTVYLLGGEYAAKLLPFVFLCLSCVLVVALCGRVASRSAALLAAAVFAATPVVQLISGAMFTDTLWATFLLGAALLIVHWTEWGDTAALPLAGILLGAAMATKLVALSFAAPCFLWAFGNCFGRRRAIDRKSLAALLLAAVLFAIVAAPPYATAWIKTGNPVFPYFNDIFRSTHYDTTPNWDDGRWKTPLTWRAPLDLTFRSSKYLEGQNGALGLSWIFILLLLVAAPRETFQRPVVGALAIGACYFLITWSRASYLRYFVPAFPLLLFGFAAYLGKLGGEQPKLYRTMMGATAAGILAGTFLLPSSGYWHKDFTLNPLSFHEEAAAYRAQMAPLRGVIDYLNRTARGEPVGIFWVGIAGLEGRPYTSGSQTYEFFRQCERARSADAVKELMSRNGIRRFVAPLPPCGQPNMPQLTEFLQRYTQERFRNPCLYVAELKAGL